MPISKSDLQNGEEALNWQEAETPGEAVRLLRRQSRLFQRELASKIGCRAETLSQMEKGKRTIRLPMAKKIGEVLKVDLLGTFADYFARKTTKKSTRPSWREKWQEASSPGQAIRILRGNLIQWELAHHMGCSRVDISNMELGKRKIGVKTAWKIGEFFRVKFLEAFPDYFGPGGSADRAMPLPNNIEKDMKPWNEAKTPGEAIRLLRLSRYPLLTQYELGQYIGCHENTLSEIELGKRRLRSGLALRLKMYFNVDLMAHFPVYFYKNLPYSDEDTEPGQAILRLRKYFGWTRKELGKMIGVDSPDSILKREQLKYAVPRAWLECIDCSWGTDLLKRFSGYFDQTDPDSKPDSLDDLTPGAAIKRLRSYHRLSLRAFGAKVEVSPETIRKWEAGIVAPSIVCAKKIDDIFESNLVQRFGDLMRKPASVES